jgi:hypothetical protein
MLSDRERGYLRTLRRRRRGAIAVGLLLTVAGGLYAIWGAGDFRARVGVEALEERSAPPWDPIAQLARLFTPDRERLAEAEPQTDTERILIEELDERTTLAAQLLVLLVRFVFASLVLTTGLILLSNALVTGRLAAMLDSVLDRQREPEQAER